jgi:hypothetical protein
MTEGSFRALRPKQKAFVVLAGIVVATPEGSKSAAHQGGRRQIGVEKSSVVA